MAAWVALGAVPAAVAGARASIALPDRALMLLLAVVMIWAGAQTLRRSGDEHRGRASSAVVLVAVGALVGFGSAVTGTGGPVLLVPMLLVSGTPVLTAVGVAQVVQLPVAGAASAGYALFGQVDFALGSVLGLAAVGGVLAGAALAHIAQAAVLTKAVAAALIGAGLLVAARTALDAPRPARTQPSLALATPGLAAATASGREGILG
jgi:uncharacterized membrane protein YfcA